jgi:predicted TIM-barrel fold metal-dependent hydrolase
MPEFRVHCEKADALQPSHYDPTSADPMYRGDGRIALCDEFGITHQWMVPTFLGGVSLQAMMSGKPGLHAEVLAAWNSWAAEQVAGYEDRLHVVTQTRMEDLDWTIDQMKRMRQAGSQAFALHQHPTKSLSHPDFEPLWSAAEELGMAGYVHVAFSQAPGEHPSWKNNGRGIHIFQQPVTSGENRGENRKLISALTLDGVFERHPKLRIVMAEVTMSWLDAYLHELEAKVGRKGFDGLPQDNIYDLPMLPSEYVVRQVRVAANPGMTDTGHDYLTPAQLMDRLDHPELIVFSTDWPHVEGRKDPGIWDEFLPDDADLRASFYGRSMEEFLAGVCV